MSLSDIREAFAVDLRSRLVLIDQSSLPAEKLETQEIKHELARRKAFGREVSQMRRQR